LQRIHQAIFNLLKDEQGKFLLDLACGQGELGTALGDEGVRVIFADRYDFPPDRRGCVKVDLRRPLPFKNERFDMIICADSLQYLENHEAFFAETNRLLAPKGTLVISFPNILTLSERFYFLRRGWFSCFRPVRGTNRQSEWANVVYHVFSFVEIYQYLEKNGFEIIKVFSPDISKKGKLIYSLFKAIYFLGLIFDQDIEKDRLIRWLMSRDFLKGDHLIVHSVKNYNGSIKNFDSQTK
jgi:ubiquinone/menaquinone biosynthesis C-methylase UbiE